MMPPSPEGKEFHAASPADSHRLAIIIVSYNTRKLLRRCLQSLAAFAPADGMEVCVVDNRSEDGSVDMLRREFPDVRIIANEHNLGYSAAVNQGLEATDSEFALVLNPDIVVREGSLDTLLQFMDAHPEAGLAGSKLLNTDGSLQYSCRGFYTPMTLVMRRTLLGKIFPRSRSIRDHLMLDYDHQAARQVDWVIGACMLVRRSAVDAVGGMDERFFLYFEDVDWCFRMSRQEWQVWYVPESQMVHEHRRESAKPRLSRSFWAHLGSLLRFYEKWNRYSYGVKRYREVLKLLLFVGVDLLAVNLAFASAYGIRELFADRFASPLYTIEHYHNFRIFLNIVTLLALSFTGQYKVKRGKPAADEFLELGRAFLATFVIVVASTYVARERLISRAVVLFAFGLSWLFSWVLRRVLRSLHRRILEMHLDLRRVAIVGSLEESRELRSRLALHPELGLDIVGFVDAQSDTRAGLGRFDDLQEIIREHRIQEVIVAPSAAQAERVARMVLSLRNRAVDVKVVSGFADILSHRAQVERLADVPVLRFQRDTLYSASAAFKRLLDVLLSCVALVLGTPGCVLYWLLAKLRSRPLFLWEHRLGRDACPLDVPRVNESLGLPPSDLVNLPAWFAVLRGRLAVVGPCPLPPAWRSDLEEWQLARFDVRPGMTGFWRILQRQEGDRDTILRLDLHYVRNWSMGLDFRLLLQSLGSMLLGRGTQRLREPVDGPGGGQL